MSASIHHFIQLVFIGIIALFPVINPIGSAFIVSPYFHGLSNRERRNTVKRIAFYAFLLCTITLFTGHWILELFGLTVPVIQLAGGIMICKLGWESLSATSDATTSTNIDADVAPANVLNDLNRKIFYPITFPITTGAGTISVIFTLSAHSINDQFPLYLVNAGAILLAIAIMCLLVYFCYYNANRLVAFLGANNEQIVSRLMAFLIFCVGLQIAIGGITNLAKTYGSAIKIH